MSMFIEKKRREKLEMQNNNIASSAKSTEPIPTSAKIDVDTMRVYVEVIITIIKQQSEIKVLKQQLVEKSRYVKEIISRYELENSLMSMEINEEKRQKLQFMSKTCTAIKEFLLERMNLCGTINQLRSKIKST